MRLTPTEVSDIVGGVVFALVSLGIWLRAQAAHKQIAAIKQQQEPKA